MARARKIRGINYEEQLSLVLPKILKARFTEMVTFEKDMLKGKDTESLHNMRVAARRVQAVLKIFRACYPEDLYKKNYRNLKSIISALGEVRQVDVIIDTIKKYGGIVKGKDKIAINLILRRQNTIRKEKRKLLAERLIKLNNKGFKEKFAELYS
jgi:CHAD domain-containing protein